MKLYGSGQSRSFRVLWALEEAQLEYDYESMDLGSTEEDGTQSATYRAINFQGKVPTLVDDGLTVTESAAALNYVAACAPEKNLIPTDPKQRARYDEICFFAMSDLEQPLWTNGKHRFAIPKKYRVPEVLPTTTWEFAKSIKALQNYLKDEQYSVGGQFTMADILIAHTLAWATAFKFEVPDDLTAYMQKMMSREACQRAAAKGAKTT